MQREQRIAILAKNDMVAGLACGTILVVDEQNNCGHSGGGGKAQKEV